MFKPVRPSNEKVRAMKFPQWCVVALVVMSAPTAFAQNWPSRPIRSDRSLGRRQHYPTSSHGSCLNNCLVNWGNRSSSRTAPERERHSVPTPPSPRPIPMAIRCWRHPPLTAWLRRSRPILDMIRSAILLPSRRSSLCRMLFVISPTKALRTIQEYVAAARAPSGVGYICLGRRRLRHSFQCRTVSTLAAGFQAIHVPFKGGPEALTEVVTRSRRLLFRPDQYRASVHSRR